MAKKSYNQKIKERWKRKEEKERILKEEKMEEIERMLKNIRKLFIPIRG